MNEIVSISPATLGECRVTNATPLPKIIAAAVRYQAPKFDPACPDYGPIIISVPRPGRHHNILHPLSQISSAAAIDGEQGFLTDEGQFLNREEAMELVKKNGQLLTQNQPNQLYSEDLW